MQQTNFFVYKDKAVQQSGRAQWVKPWAAGGGTAAPIQWGSCRLAVPHGSPNILPRAGCGTDARYLGTNTRSRTQSKVLLMA